uniref:Uncharacterized protein n=1 Tax=Oryza brachyantha TaxID=4533 RepID=J3L1V1_ORYBR
MELQGSALLYKTISLLEIKSCTASQIHSINIQFEGDLQGDTLESLLGLTTKKLNKESDEVGMPYSGQSNTVNSLMKIITDRTSEQCWVRGSVLDLAIWL